jgi:hypothetical protein
MLNFESADKASGPWALPSGGPRAEVQQRLLQVLNSGQTHVWLQGPRDGGKSEVARRVTSELQKLGRLVVWFDFDLDLPNVPVDAMDWSRLLEQTLRERLPQGVLPPPSEPPSDASAVLANTTEWLLALPVKATLVLEHAEQVAQLAGGAILLAWIQALARDTRLAERIALCVISTVHASDLAIWLGSTGCDDTTQRWTTLTLEDLTREEVVAAARAVLPADPSTLAANLALLTKSCPSPALRRKGRTWPQTCPSWQPQPDWSSTLVG